MSPNAIHSLFDVLAWSSAALMGLYARKRLFADLPHLLKGGGPSSYWGLAMAGAILGAYFFGGLNLAASGLPPVGHSIAGALAGAIVGVELYKWKCGIKASTGGLFVPSLAVGIAMGRVGCFLAGLSDQTYGIPTDLPWGHDFGDGIVRHPVPLYESLAMLAFLALYLPWARRAPARALGLGFPLFALWYGLQRFGWEFLKPYGTLIGPLNLFHLVCAGLIGYAGFQLYRERHVLSQSLPLSRANDLAL